METRPSEPPRSGRKLAVGAAAMGVTNVLKTLVQVLMIPVMARLLGPAEFGLYALALPTVAFLVTLAAAGLGSSLAREPTSDSELWSTAFWFLCGLGLLAIGAVTAGAQVIALLAHQPRLPGVMAALSISILCLTLCVLPSARLTRAGRFDVYALCDFASNMVGAGLGLTLALNGAGVWSLVWQYVSAFAVRALILNIAAPQLPRLRFRLSRLTTHLAVGGSIAGGNVADFAGKLVEGAIISRTSGASVLGVFSFSNQIPRFLSGAIANPIWASLYYHALRNDGDETLNIYYRLTRLMAILLFPMSFIIAAAMPQLAHLFLGPKWVQSIPVIQILLPTTAFTFIGAQSGPILYARGRSRLQFLNIIALAMARVGSVSAIPVIGLAGAALAIGMANIGYGLIGILVPRSTLKSSARAVFAGMAGPFICASSAAAMCILLLGLRPVGVVWTFACLGAAGLGYALALLAFDRRRVGRDIDAVRSLMSPQPA